VPIIRGERPEDAQGIRSLLEAVFPTTEEAELVDRLRRSCPDCLGLVAVEDDALVGHVVFTPVTLQTEAGVVEGSGLAPLAVRPDRQRRGIGTALVHAGLDHLRAAHCPFVVVLGHPTYYPRFGFVPASRLGVRCQWDQVPDDAFMILALAPDRVPASGGLAQYRPEFDGTA
jgi:putative acetyltransferase